MVVSPSELSKNIDAGSLPYGERQGLEAALGQLTPQQAQPDQLGIPSNPLDPFMKGEMKAGRTDNLLAGLSPKPPSPISDSRVERLRAVALYAKSPVLRYLAARAIPGLLSELENEF